MEQLLIQIDMAQRYIDTLEWILNTDIPYKGIYNTELMKAYNVLVILEQYIKIAA